MKYALAPAQSSCALRPKEVGTLIVGGGPAGTAVLLAADRMGLLPQLLDKGLALVERGARIGGGNLKRYDIASDTAADSFLDAIRNSPQPSIRALAGHPAARDVASYSAALGVPLPLAAELLDRIGDSLRQAVEEGGGTVLTHNKVMEARPTHIGLWRCLVSDLETKERYVVLARNIVVATGGTQPFSLLRGQSVAGISLTQRYPDRLILPDHLLARGGIELLRSCIGGKSNPEIVIIGGSSSAISAANLILSRSDLIGPNGRVTLVHRSPLKPFYASEQAARAEGFAAFVPEDICPVSGAVNRLGGLKLEQRQLILEALGIAGRAPDPRLHLHRLDRHDPMETLAALDRADAIVAALGYRPVGMTFRDEEGLPIPLLADGPGHPPMIDQHCRVLKTSGNPLPNVYGIGLASGYRPDPHFGGETSFRGQVNDVRMWQSEAGPRIVEQLLSTGRERF
jgi:hypothetical protein